MSSSEGYYTWKIMHRDPKPSVLLVQPVDDSDMRGMDSLVEHVRRSCGVPFALAVLPVRDWNRDLSPWEAPPVFGDRAFGAGASETLRYIEEELLPGALGELELSGDAPAVLGGYSLAGFFSLWASYQTDRFAAVCAASPSVWFPGWIDYAERNAPKAGYIYLSLGDKEEKARNPVMAAVGDCIRRQHALLGGAESKDVTLEWNPGNHFKEADIRTAKGFAWCLNRLSDAF